MYVESTKKGDNDLPKPFSKLRGRIIAEYGTIGEFASALGVTPSSISTKINGRKKFSPRDIFIIGNMLNLGSDDDIREYFFTDECTADVHLINDKSVTRDAQTIGKRIRKARATKGLTQTGLGDIAGISKGAVAKYESGTVTNIPSENLVAICHALDVDPNYLLGWSDKESDAR